MSWQHQRSAGMGQLLALPEDGIAVSNHPPGWLGKRWRSLLEQAGREAKDRVLRGRNYARRGRMRGLSISPGQATADVYCEEVYRPSVQVRPFSRQEWQAIIRELTSDLNLIASLLVGDLPAELVARLEDRGIHLLPTFDEVSFDCDCGDYVMPCTHVATVFHVLTDALDGEPFLLLTLRGRDREQLLATLRSHWGDDAPLNEVITRTEEAPPKGPWFTAPKPLPTFGCHWATLPQHGAGLRALGPPPGEKDLLQTLLPLYEAGAEKMREVIDAVPDRVPPKRRPKVELPVWDEVDVSSEDDLTEVMPEEAAAAVQEHVEAPPEPERAAPEEAVNGAVDALTERLVDTLAEFDGATSGDLAQRLGETVSAVRAELVDLADLGMVYKIGEGGQVRWFLG